MEHVPVGCHVVMRVRGVIDTSMSIIPAVPSVATSSRQTLTNICEAPNGSSVTSGSDVMRSPMKPMVWMH
eukprot:12441284-Ditylum_brightwellii.AAC.1